MTHGFRTFDHTADIGLEIWGEDFNSIFEEAASGLFSLITDPASVEPKEQFEINIEADGGEALLLLWLKELLFIFETKRIAFSKFQIKELTFHHLKALVFGEPINLIKHPAGREVKAVTHHQFEFEKTPNGFKARVILDI